MKKVYAFELANLIGGSANNAYCADVQYMASTHLVPENPTEQEQKAEDEFWKMWLRLYDMHCS